MKTLKQLIREGRALFAAAFFLLSCVLLASSALAGTVYYSSAWVDKAKGSSVTYDGKNYTIGTNAFGDYAAAQAAGDVVLCDVFIDLTWVAEAGWESGDPVYAMLPDGDEVEVTLGKEGILLSADTAEAVQAAVTEAANKARAKNSAVYFNGGSFSSYPSLSGVVFYTGGAKVVGAFVTNLKLANGPETGTLLAKPETYVEGDSEGYVQFKELLVCDSAAYAAKVVVGPGSYVGTIKPCASGLSQTAEVVLSGAKAQVVDGQTSSFAVRITGDSTSTITTLSNVKSITIDASAKLETASDIGDDVTISVDMKGGIIPSGGVTVLTAASIATTKLVVLENGIPTTSGTLEVSGNSLILKETPLKVNGELVDGEEHEGWMYEDGVLKLDGSTDYTVNGASMDGAVRIMVEDDAECDMTISGVRLGKENLGPGQNLITFGAGAKINLVLDGMTAFRTNDGIAPIGVNDGATLNLCGTGTVSACAFDIEGDGSVTMQNPTTIMFVEQANAEAAAAVVKPFANEDHFPGIEQEAYADRFVVSAVQSGPDRWALDYQINEDTSNEVQEVISSEETLSNLVEGLVVDGTPTVTITPIPGFYYGIAGTNDVAGIGAAEPPEWFAGQEGVDLTVTGPENIEGETVFYQLRVTRCISPEEDEGGRLIGTAVEEEIAGDIVMFRKRVTIAPEKVANASKVNVYTNDTIEVAGPPYVVYTNAAVTVTYTADAGYQFPGGAATWTTNFTANAATNTVTIPASEQPVVALTGVTVGGMDVSAGSGEGWTFADGVLSLTGSQSYVLAGANTKGAVRVEVSAKNATLKFDNLTLSGLKAKAAVTVLSGAKLTLPGDGKLTGGNLLVVADGGTADVLGGVFNASGTPFSVDDDGSLTVYGCVSVENEIEEDYLASGYTCVEVSTEGGDSNYVVGKDINVVNDKLTEGTYTFCPTNAQYEAVELFVEPGTFITKKATTPVTWVLGVECPDYLAGYGYAVTNTFKKWAKAYPPGDPDGIYKNAFLLNVAQNREAEAVAAFKIGSIAVTNEIVGTVTNTVVVIERAKPLASAKTFNGITWLQCATNGLDEADWFDIETGRYTEAEKSFFIQRIDFEHKLTPEAFPSVPTGTKTVRFIVKE